MIELHSFYNDGSGWVCRRCENELTTKKGPKHKHSRMFREGESESKTPQLSNLALAKWFDAARRTLICPRCKVTELVDIS